MDTAQLILDIKARFAHNSAKAYLKDKYSSKLIVAEQGGLWTASPEILSFLSAAANSATKKVIIIDNFDNPVEVNVIPLLNVLSETYSVVMKEWNAEWESLESKR
jgi:hypothetical protein